MPAALLQHFVPGVPMSASFLVGDGPQAWLIGTGIQRMAIRNGRFVYEGGTMPTVCPGVTEQLRPALYAVEGLRGFTGVDFIWDPTCRRATILEINPRPTTSCVGLCRLLPPGYFASAWLDACEPTTADFTHLDDLARLVGQQKRVTFSASGEFIDNDVGLSA
jgi:predicted ATP-grasp superfamily ATP-dependent carboligase